MSRRNHHEDALAAEIDFRAGRERGQRNSAAVRARWATPAPSASGPTPGAARRVYVPGKGGATSTSPTTSKTTAPPKAAPTTTAVATSPVIATPCPATHPSGATCSLGNSHGGPHVGTTPAGKSISWPPGEVRKRRKKEAARERLREARKAVAAHADEVRAMLAASVGPDGWPIDIHRQIAAALGLPPRLVRDHIARGVARGRLTNPAVAKETTT